jgi:hypothetical protein
VCEFLGPDVTGPKLMLQDLDPKPQPLDFAGCGFALMGPKKRLHDIEIEQRKQMWNRPQKSFKEY